jgi:rhodanese-related sulfurtransferase
MADPIVQRMQATELSTYLQNSQPLLIDVREPWEFEICHLADSINIPMAQIPHYLEIISEARECVMICHHGVRSLHVIRYLQQYKMGHLINLEGGVDTWAREVDLNMPLY